MGEPSFEDLLSSPWLQFDLDGELLPHLVDFGPPPVRGFVTELQERRPWIFDLRDEGAQT